MVSYSKDYYTNNRERVRKGQREYYYTHRKEILIRAKTNHANKRDKHLARMVRYRQRAQAEWSIIIHELGYDRCVLCGYNRCIHAIEFHHMNPMEKDMGMAQLRRTYPTETKTEELEKTIPLCANCHREWHYSNS